MNNLHKTQDSNNPIPNTNTNNTKSKKSYFFVILSVFIIFCILSFDMNLLNINNKMNYITQHFP